MNETVEGYMGTKQRISHPCYRPMLRQKSGKSGISCQSAGKQPAGRLGGRFGAFVSEKMLGRPQA
jgi:hypothetical protein